MRRSARALIIKDKKLLLVGNNEVDFFWSPGGGIEESESHHDALKRELQEEVGLELKSAKHFASYVSRSPNPDEGLDMEFFIVEADGEPEPNNEVEVLYWYSAEDFRSGVPKVSPHIGKTILPKLIIDRLL
jgi:8-oxo-dGTP diphosphatase